MMTDNEIKKALECCSKGFGNCEGCPYDNDNNDCVTNDGKTLIFQDTLDLINRQQAEVERYKGVIKLLEKDVQTAKSEAVNEFVKKFEKKIKDVKFTIGQTWEIKCALKQTLKELTENDFKERDYGYKQSNTAKSI